MPTLSTKTKRILVLLHDIAVACLAWAGAYLLRFNFEIPPSFQASMWHSLAWVLPLQIASFVFFGLYRGMWRFASIPDLKLIIQAVGFAALCISTAFLLLQLGYVIPRSVLLLDPLLLVFLMGGSRFIYRSWKDHHLYRFSQLHGQPVLVVGGGDSAISLIKELDRSQEWRVVGLLDNSPELRGRQLYGIRILGSIDHLPRYAEKLGVRHVIIAMPGEDHIARKKAVHIANRAGLIAYTVPSFDDLMTGRVKVSSIRPIDIEDLLGRDPVQLNSSGLSGLLHEKTVMVTGAAGSIGSELCRQIAQFRPRQLLLFDISEYGLYELERQFQERFPNLEVICLIGDVRNRERVDHVLEHFQPSILFHAAAYKHVPMLECNNLAESLQNNVLGTYHVAQACKRHDVKKCVLVSTDKAVNPTNVMGASKRMAEMVCQGLQDAGGTRFIIVRFGNVLGSSGSVIPKFREQIARGGPVTVTHPDITRYFMSIPEASQLVLQAGLMGNGGEIFVLDMGSPVRIADLARDMIRLSGFQNEEIKVVYTGLRPGEKLFEELLADEEKTLATPHPKLRIASARPFASDELERLTAWIVVAQSQPDATLRQQIAHWVPEYRETTP
jgi:FlaA1/EpsC-like NDP-sugar epimerase